MRITVGLLCLRVGKRFDCEIEQSIACISSMADELFNRELNA